MSATPPISAVAAEALATLPSHDLVPGDVATPTVAGPSFGKLIAEGMAEVDSKIRTGEAGLQRLAAGDVQNLHHVMIQLEESRLSFQLMMQVRNRLLEAYQDVMKMQI